MLLRNPHLRERRLGETLVAALGRKDRRQRVGVALAELRRDDAGSGRFVVVRRAAQVVCPVAVERHARDVAGVRHPDRLQRADLDAEGHRGAARVGRHVRPDRREGARGACALIRDVVDRAVVGVHGRESHARALGQSRDGEQRIVGVVAHVGAEGLQRARRTRARRTAGSRRRAARIVARTARRSPPRRLPRRPRRRRPRRRRRRAARPQRGSRSLRHPEATASFVGAHSCRIASHTMLTAPKTTPCTIGAAGSEVPSATPMTRKAPAGISAHAGRDARRARLAVATAATSERRNGTTR